MTKVSSHFFIVVELLFGRKIMKLIIATNRAPYDVKKDKAADYLISTYPDYFPVYFGDDITDIPAFKEVTKHNGIAVWVGEKNSIPPEVSCYSVKIEELNYFINNIAQEF
jgi:hypothetical protein